MYIETGPAIGHGRNHRHRVKLPARPLRERIAMGAAPYVEPYPGGRLEVGPHGVYETLGGLSMSDVWRGAGFGLGLAAAAMVLGVVSRGLRRR